MKLHEGISIFGSKKSESMCKRLCFIMPRKTERKLKCAERRYVLPKMINIGKNIQVNDQQIQSKPEAVPKSQEEFKSNNAFWIRFC